MGAISALSTSVDALKRNTVLFGVAFAVAIANFGFTGVTAVVPPETAVLVSLPLSVATFLLTPFFVGGMLAMAEEGLDGLTGLGTFVAGGKANYLRLLAASVLFAVLMIVVVFAVVITVAVVSVFAVGTAGGIADAANSAGGLVVFGLLLLGVVAMLLPLFVFQFYGAAVVVSDLGPVAALKRSARLVVRNVVPTLGYTAVALVVGLVVGVVATFVSLLTRPEVYSTPTVTVPEGAAGLVLGVAAVAVVVTAVASAFGSVYQVAFYDDCLDRTAFDDDAPAEAAVDAT